MRVKLVVSCALVAGCGADGGKTPPPFGVPISGGTLLVTRAGDRAVVSDPDRDRIVAVDLRDGRVIAELALTAGDEPGRVIEDAAGRIHVALRRGGALLTLASPGATEATRRHVCAEPRGLAYDAGLDAVHVACTGGELVTFPAAAGDATRRLRLDRDLRDVIVAPGGGLVVTRFKTAELLSIDAAGAVIARVAPPPLPRFGGDLPFFDAPDSPDEPPGPSEAVAEVAWRTLALPDGRIVMSHQRHVTRTLGTEEGEGGYGGGCNTSPVEASIAVIEPGLPPRAAAPIARGALPVDLAASPSGDQLAVVLAGQRTVTVIGTALATSRGDEGDMCRPPEGEPDGGDDDREVDDELGTPTSVAFAGADVVIFYPEKPALVVRSPAGTKRVIALPGDRAYDLGRATFHDQTPLQLSCASCHPEGREDGRVWSFAKLGNRRTQSLAGGLLERAPFHWSGDMATLDVLMDDVFAQRMAGGPVSAHQKVAIGAFLDRIPAPAGAQVDAAAIDRGREVFERAACASCHNGDLLTNNALVDVGTGGRFKVPSLIGVGARAPFMHDGCATTLGARFGACGGGDRHGQTSTLTQAELLDLVSFLESL